MIKQLLAAGAALGIVSTGFPALAANCANRSMVVERLQSKYNERLAAGGLQEIGESHAIVEVWASQKTGTFTVMLTRPDGTTCVMATGTDWHQVSFEPVSGDAES